MRVTPHRVLAARALLYVPAVPVPHAPHHQKRLAFLVGAIVVLLAPGPRAETQAPAAPPPPSPVARLFGVSPNSPRATLEDLAQRTRVDCRAMPPVQAGSPPRPALPVVCASAFGTPVPASGTYWYEDDQLARAFLLVGAIYLQDIDQAVRAFYLMQAWVNSTIGVPTRPLVLPPGWSASGGVLPPGMRMQQLVAGQVRLSASWERPDAIVELWLAGERGQPTLALGVRRRAAAPVAAPPVAAAPNCAPEAVTEALLDLFPPAPPEARARAAALLAACKIKRAEGALGAARKHDDAPAVRAQAERSLAELSRVPAARPAPPAPIIAAAPATPAPLYGPPSPPADAGLGPQASGLGPESGSGPEAGGPRPEALPRAPAPRPTGRNALAEAPAPQPPEEERPKGPVSGVPLAIGASTVAGATLMRNISMWGGLTSATPQVLLGSTGAVIGFGTSWGLARFGLRPTVEQAAWYANVTAWGTLAGVGAWSVSGSDSETAKYAYPVVGQALGMGLGVWSASKWNWTLPQLALADSFVLGAGLSSMGFDLLQDEKPKLTLKDAIGAPIVMVGSAIASRYLDPTGNDAGLMTTTALAGGWTGSMLASGIAGTDWLDSRQSWGGAAAGLGLGYLGGAAAGAFVETPPWRLGVAGGGMLAGNALGLGLHLTVQGFSHETGPTSKFTSDEVHARALSAAVGGLVLGGAGYAYAPHLRPGPSAASMTILGATYGAGTWWLASAASYKGQDLGDAGDARFGGGLLTGATLGALTGLVTSRWFAPDAQQHLMAAGSTALGMSAGLGVAKLTTDTKGTPDAVGVLAGAAVGLSGGAVAATKLQLRAPDVGAGFVGMLEGLLVGTLAPTLSEPTWQDSRQTAGGALLGLSLGAGAGIAAAHLTDATGGQVGVVTTAGSLGLLAGLGAGWMLPCDPLVFPPSDGVRVAASDPCTSRAARIGAVVGSLGLMGAATALEPHLHLSTTLGPDAATLGALGAAFGAADGLMLAGALDDGGTISGTPSRQIWGGMLAGASTEFGIGIVASKYARLKRGDGWALAGGKLTGGMFGLGAAMLARDKTGAADTLATLTGSLAGEVAAGVAQAYTPLDGTDVGAAFTGAAFGGFLGSLVPKLDEPRWDGIDHRKTGGGFLVGLSAGAIAGAAVSHATDAQGRDVGFTLLGGLDGMFTGLGMGLLLADESDSTHPDPSTRPERMGMAIGTPLGLAVGALAFPRLRFDEGDGPFVAAGTGLGAWMGFWIPALGHASFDTITEQKRWGGILAGAGLGGTAASLLTPALQVDPDLVTNAIGLDAVWSAAGAGAGALASTRDDAPVWGMLGAGTAGLVLGGALHRSIEIGRQETPFLTLATAEGAWLGAWIPSLTDSPTSRQRVGSLALGGFGSLGLAAVLSPVVKPSGDMVMNAAAVDALWTGAGAGAGLLFSGSDKAPVWSMLGAGLAGLGTGAALHDAIDIGADDAPLLALAGGEGVWLGAWLPALFDKPTDRQRAGALMLGGFGALGAATVLSPVLKLDGDVAENAAGVGALWTGAGAGAGLLFSESDKAPVWGHLTAGAAGLVLGGALHRSIELDHVDTPLLTLTGAEGLWLGGWFPYLLQDGQKDAVSDRERAGALMLGGFGGLGLATVASGALELSPGRAGYGGVGSVIGSALGGGIALLSPSLHGQGGVGLMLGGTATGLAAGLGVAPLMANAESARLVGGAATGAALGVSESLLFAWSGHAEGSDEYAGAALVGGGVGTALGLAISASPPDDHSSTPAAAGFAAWGAWMGAFTGSLVKSDTHDIVLGGLLGANAGFLAGYGLLKADLVEPRDFGWLSLFGALGTVTGAGVGAGASQGNPTAIRAGLAIGPAAGMIAGAFVLPKLRNMLGPTGAPAGKTARARGTRRVAVAETEGGAVSDDVEQEVGGETAEESLLGRKLAQVGSVTDWAPMVGAMPAAAETGPAPVLFGVTGHWK
jgi:hypothetical protein